MEQGTATAAMVCAGALVLPALGLLARYLTKTEKAEEVLSTCKALLEALARSVAERFVAHLSASDLRPSTYPVLGPDGHYVERDVPIWQGEEAGNVVHAFLRGEGCRMAEYRNALRLQRAWCRWRDRLTRSLLFLVVACLVVLAVVGGLRFLTKGETPLWISVASLSILGTLVICVFTALIRMNSIESRLLRMRSEYVAD